LFNPSQDYAHESYDDDSKSDDGDGDFHLDYFNKYRIVAAWNGLKDNSNSGFTNNSFHRHGSLTSVISNLNINKNSSGLRTAWSQVGDTFKHQILIELFFYSNFLNRLT